MNEILRSPIDGEQVEGIASTEAGNPVAKQLVDHALPDMMSRTIKARDVTAIEQIFARVKRISAEAAASEILHRREKNIESQRAAHEMRVDAEHLLGQWLIQTEATGLRFMGQPARGVKIGTPPDPGLLTLEKLGINRRESSRLQEIARLSPAAFQILRADLTAGPTTTRFSPTKSHQGRRDARGGTGTDLLAVPKSVPSTLRELAKLHRDINKAETYRALRQIECKAEALKKLHADIDVVRVEAGKVIVFANHRIGEELNRLPVAKASGSNQHKKKEPLPGKAAPLKETVGSRTRGTRLKKFGSQPKPVIQAAVEKLADEGKDITVSSVIKTIAAEETAKKREESRTDAPQPSDPAPKQNVEITPGQSRRVGAQEHATAELKPNTAEAEEPDESLEMDDDDLAWERQGTVRKAYLTAPLDDIIEFSSHLQSCLRLEVWKHDRIDREGSYGPTSFLEFLHKSYPAGLGIDFETLRWLIDGATLLLKKYPGRSNANTVSLCEELRRELDRLESEAALAHKITMAMGAIDTADSRAAPDRGRIAP